MNAAGERARRLVVRYGWNSTCYQILNPGFEYWFPVSAEYEAVVGFVRYGRVWVSAASPICAEENFDRALGDFEAHARSAGAKVCWVCSAERMHRALSSRRDHRVIGVGAQPVWNPEDWENILVQRASLRAQLSRARNKGVWVERLSGTSEVRNDPSLRRCLEEWLETRPLPPMHFLVEPDVLDGDLSDRLIFVARAETGVVGFLIASPIPERQGYLIEQIARGRGAPNGVAELMIDACMRVLAAQGCSYITMGLVALADKAQPAIEAHNPWWLKLLMRWARAHFARFYHFDGLERFRQKMCPREWEMIYAVSAEGRFPVLSFRAVLGAFFGGVPEWILGRALLRAAWQELSWAGAWLLGLLSGKSR
jgi:phosphatidylglycerol lysyltransferase